MLKRPVTCEQLVTDQTFSRVKVNHEEHSPDALILRSDSALSKGVIERHSSSNLELDVGEPLPCLNRDLLDRSPTHALGDSLFGLSLF